MTQQDKEREAFEIWASNFFPLKKNASEPLLSRQYGAGYRYINVDAAWHAWQAARDQYAPKFTAN